MCVTEWHRKSKSGLSKNSQGSRERNLSCGIRSPPLRFSITLYWDMRVFFFLCHFCRIPYFTNFTDLGLFCKIQKIFKNFYWISLPITSYTLGWHDDLHRVLSMRFLTWDIYAEIPYIQENFGKSAPFWVSVMSALSDCKSLGSHLLPWSFQ